MPDKIDTLYDALKADGAVTKSREHFRSKMLASGAEGYKNRKQLYDALKADGAVSSKNYEEFAARLGLHAVKPAPAKPATNTAKQILKSRPTMQIVDGESVPAKRKEQPAKSGSNPLTQASQRYWQAQAEMVKPVTPTQSYAPGELLQKPKSNRELVDAAKKQLRVTKPQAQPQPWRFTDSHNNGTPEASVAGVIDSGTEAIKRQHASMTAQLKQNSPLPMTEDEVAARAEDEVAHEDYVAEQKRQQDFDRGINGLLAKYKTKDAAEKAWANAEARTKASREAHNDKIWSDYAMMGGGPQARMAAAGETYTSNLADYLKEHDLQMMANDAWASLGRAKQQGLISGMADMVRKQYPKMSDGEVRKMATRLARQHSDQAVFDLAVKKNTPKSATDLFLRHAIGMSSVAMLQEGLARSKAGSTGDWAAREVAEQKYNKGLKNKAASIAGSVVGLAVDPLTIISAGVGSVGAKAATAASAKLIGKAATRKAATTLGGRIAMGAIQGAANFGTFEAGREVAEQARWGGHRNEDTGDVEGYSLGAVGKQFGHGAVMGAATGVVAPMVGNISDKLVKATASTAGKAAIRTGELGVSTLAEGTIFSVPEWASGNRDAMDVWTDNLAMMAGFKGHHLIKSVPHTIDALRKADNPTNMAERNHNRRSFEERLRMVLDGQHTDLALSKEEQDELKRGGYDDLNILVTDHARYVDKQKPDGKSREADPSRTIESKTHNDDVSYDIPYNRFEQLMSDGQISEAARAKMYYYLTGHVVPMSTVIGGSTFESVGQDGKTNYTVQSIGANGVVTSRTFANKRQADLEETRIMRQAELNGIDIGEQHYNNLADSKRFSRACNIVADEIGAPVNMIKELMHRDPNTITPTEQDVVKRVTEHYDSLADDFSLDAVRKDVETDTGVDIDKAISKDASKRSSDEQRAVKTYISRLYDGVKMPKWEFVNDPSYNTRRIDITDDDTPYDDEVADEEKGEMPVDHSADKAYTDGYNATDVADRKDVKMRHDELRGELSFATDEDFKILDDSPTVAKEAVMSHDDWSENQKEQALAYINAKEALAGVVDRIKEDADSMEAQQHEELKQKQHTDGALHPATLKETDEKGHGKEVFIVDGHVQMTEDGSMVDHDNSDKTVVVFDPATGERKMIDPTSDTGLSAVGEVLNFEDEQAKISENAQQYIQEQYDEMNGKVRVELGQKIVLPTGETGQVVFISYDDRGAADFAVMLEDGSLKNVSRSELQQMADEQAIADYRQRNGIKDEPPASSEVSEPAEVTQGENVVEGVPSDFTPDMELTIRDENGTEKPALVMGRVRYENGTFVPDENGSIVEYYADGEVMHEHESKLADKVVSHVSSEQEDVQAVDTPATEAEAPKDDNTSDSDVVAADEDVTENVPATHAEVSEETTDEAEQEQTALSRIPKDEKGNPMLEETDPETAWDGTVEYLDNAEDAREYVDGMVAQLTKEVESAKKRVGKVKNTGSMEQFKADKAAAREEQAAAERRLAHWQQIAGVDEARKEAERQRAAEVRAEEERIAHDKAVAQAQADFEARKAAEAERKAVGNENPMPAITEKWNTATKIDGHKDEIMLPNGEPLKGHYVLHESGASSPSHNSENWAKTDGFPMDANDNSVNDRDYERDRDAQRHTEGIAQQYDQRALQNVPVVSNDGVVLSGNGRTIAGEIAARNNTDGAYVDYLKEYAHKFGFTPEQVEGMHHPRVSFVPDDAMPYTAETFARFNQQEMKSQNKTEQAVKLGKTVSDDSFGRIVRTINGYDTLGDFYNDPQASLGAVNDLHGAGVIPQAQMAEMVDGGRGNQRLSAVGREFLENMLIGKAFDGNPDVVRMLTEIPSMRQSVITALGEISDNIALGDGWALQNELADAVKLVYDARNDGDYQHGDIVSVYARQGRLFADPDELQTVADFNNMTMLMLADVLNDKRVTMLKTTLALYNKDARDSANGVQDIFAGGVVSREEILRNVIKFINNAQRKELEAARRATVERRKKEGVQQDGTPPQVDNEPTAAAEQPSAERGQSKSNTLSQENTEPRQIKLSDPRTMSDEEKQRRGEMLRDAYAIEVAAGQIVATEEMSARRAAEKWWDENVSEPAFYDTEAGEVEINRNSVESSLAHRYGQMKLDAITSLIDGFENAVYLGTMPDSRERGVVDHYFAYPIMYNGERCYVFCRAMQDANKNRLYVHEVFVAERIKKGDTLQTAASKPHGCISLYRDILANVLDASKEEVRSASEEQNEQSATDNTLRAEDKSDNPTTPNGNVSNSSAGKVTESSEELQGKEDKFTPAPIEDGEDYVDYAARVAAVKVQHDAIKAAEDATDTNPTEGQKKAGNYKKGHVQIGAFDISVEQPKGSVRRGKDADGKEWESKMNNTYGYFRGTEGVDGDHIDVFLSNDIDGWNGRKVFVVDQYNPDGTFDEHKVMLGFNDADDAKSNYLANYEKGWENGRRIDVSTTNLEDFEKWISSSHRKTKPFAEYKGVKIDEVQSPSAKYQPIIQATFNKIKREQGIIEPIAEKKRKPFTVFDITIKDHRRPMFGGIYHDGGMAVATNGLVMFVHKEAYDKAKDDKIITSKGDVIEGKFPEWRSAIPKETIPTGLQTEPLLEFVNGALARMKAEKAKKYEVDGALAYIKFQDGNVVCCQLVDLQKMLRAAKSVGADDLRFGTDKEVLVAESPAGKAIVIIQGEEKARYNAGYNNFAYEAPTVKGEEEVSDGSLDNPYPSEQEVEQESKDDNTGNVVLKQFSNVLLSADTESQRLATDAALEGLKRAGVPVEVVSDEQAAAMLGEQKGVELSAKQKRALETASPAMQDHSTVVSSADGTKVLKDLDNTIEEDLKITDHVQFMKTPSGTLYGWTVGGKIYLTKDGLNPNTPIHEYTHLWARAMKERNKEGWQSVKELLRDTPVWDEVLKDKNYQDILDDEDAIASEALSRISGQKNAEKMEAEARKMIDEAKDYVDKAKAISLLERMKSALKKFWNWVGKDLFGIKKFSSVDEITDRVLYDLTNGTDLKGAASEKVEKQQVSTGSEEERAIIEHAKESGTYMKAPNGEPTRLTEKQWAQVRTKAFKSWFGDWEKAARIEKLRKSEPVVITGEEYKGKYELNRDSAKAWIKDNLRGEYTIADTGEKIAIGRKGINKVTSHSMGNETHLKSLIAVPKMLEQSVFITEEKADKLNAQYPTYRYYVVGLNIAGVDYTAKLTIGVDENGNKYYDHALTEIEKGKLLDQINGQAVDNGFMSTGAEPNPSVTDSKDTKLVSILQTNSSKFVDENGEPMVFYHNTNNNFSVFDSKRNGTHTDAGWLGDGFYFYGDENEGSGYGNIKMGVFLNVRDPYYATSKENNQLAEANSRDMSVDFRENLEEEGYDGVFYNGDLRQEAVVFEPNQIKSATDNNGEFSQESDDIRYRESKGSSERTLVGIHNISADKLSKAIKQGGLANPSVAVIDISKQQHTGYGEISLIMPSDKINKRTGKNAGTFEGDAWTPMYPSVERQMSREGSLVMEHDIKALPNEMQLGVRNALRNWLDSRVDTKLSYLYLFQQGKAPDFETIKPKYNKEVHRAFGDIMHEVTNVYELSQNDIEKLVDLYVKTELNGDIDEFNQSYERNIAKHKEILSNKKPGSLRYKIASIYLRDAEEYGRPIDVLQRFVDEVWRDKNTQGRVSIEKTFDAANKKIKEDGLENDYKKWTDGLNERYQTKEVIFDGFTPSGMRRYVPNTLENVSKLMKKQGRNASNGIGSSFSNFAASVMKANTSLDSIRKKKGKLTNDHQELDDFEEKWQNVYVDLSKKLQPDANAYDDYGFARLQEAASEADPQAYLQKEYGVTLSDEDTQRLKDMVKAIKEERPSMYFETKFERPVTFDEFAAAVVPHNTDAEIKQQLRDAGLKVVEYEAGNEESRAKAVEEASKSDDIRFRQEERAARELAEVNERFNEELQKQIDGTLPAGHVYQLGMPGEILLSTGIPNLPIQMNAKRLQAKATSYGHDFDLSEVKDLVNVLQHPLALFSYGDKTKAQNIIVSLQKDGNNFIVGLSLNPSVGGHKLEINSIRNVFPKKNAEWLNWISQGKALYIDKEKVQNLIDQQRTILADVDYLDLDSAAKILKDFQNPTIDEKNHSALSENTLPAEPSHDREAMRNEAVQLSDKLHTPIKIVEDVKDITHSNAEVERRKRNSKGWYDVRTGEVVVVLPNNRDVEDVAATVMHETVAHKGLRELVGEEHYDEFLDEVYEHLRGDLKQRVDAEAGRSFVDDSTKNGERAKSYEQHRRTAVDELFGDMAEKPFEEFSEGERTLWQKLKEVVRKLLDKFLASLKLPRWFELGDNELRYMLWRSKERLERGKEHPIDMARDMVMREELGLSEAARMRMGDAPDTFKARQRRTVEEKGVVMPGLNEAEVKVVRVPRHSFTGTGKDVLKAAEEWARKNIVGTHTAINSQGKRFEYEIGNKSVGKYVSSSSVQKSHNLGIHLSVLKRLPEVIQTSIEAEIHPDYTKNDSRERTVDSLVNVNSLILRFYGAVDIDGKIYRVKTTIREFGDANLNAKAHNYEVTKIELIEAPSTYGLEANHEHLAMTSASSISVAKLLKDVEKSYDSGKKVLDESRKTDENPILYRDGGETEDIWKDKSMGLHERTTAAAMRLADKHQENKTLRNDAMRAIGNNLADLRKAMSLQRKFDMATVKRVSDLARVLMNNGYIGDMTQQEVKSLLAAVRNSVGHNDIDRDVQKVMEIMVKNQLRRAEKALSALEAIKGSKVNAKGVKVQGKLDAAGGQLMEVFKNIIEPIVNNHTLM